MKNTRSARAIYAIGFACMLLICLGIMKVEVNAVDFPGITVTFDPTDESVIVEGVPAKSADGLVEYQLEGYMNYEKERIETFCYGPNVMPYHIADKKAYIFNWADAEFILPCSGEYKFTAYITARYIDAQGTPVEEKGPKTTITITLNKKDESTNWGPGLPNTTVETYDLGQIKGKDKTIKIEEPEYTWIINGKDVESVPEIRNLSLKITPNPNDFVDTGVDAFFGDTIALKFNIEYSGEFGFTAVLDYKIGAEYVGKYANLFYVVGDGTFEYMGSDVVDENGMASFSFTRASDYVVATTDVEYTGQKLNIQDEGNKTEEAEIAETKQEETKQEEVNQEENESEVAESEGLNQEENESEVAESEGLNQEENEGEVAESEEINQEESKNEEVGSEASKEGTKQEEAKQENVMAEENADNVTPWVMIGIVAAIGIVAVLIYVKRRKK